MFPGSKSFNLAAFVLCMAVTTISSAYFSYKKSSIDLNLKIKNKFEKEIESKNEIEFSGSMVRNDEIN